MTEPKINTVTMVVKAYDQGEALAIAMQANENLLGGKMPYTYTEALTWDEWLVILADNRDEAHQAQEKFYQKQEDQPKPNGVCYDRTNPTHQSL